MIGVVAALSEDSPFEDPHDRDITKDNDHRREDSDIDETDKSNLSAAMKEQNSTDKWFHPSGDVLARLAAVGGKI